MFLLASDTRRTEGGGFNTVEGGIAATGAGCTGDVAGAGAGSVAGAKREGVGAGRGDGAVALSGSGLGAEKYTSFGGSVGGTRIGITHGTSGLCHVTSREYTTVPVSLSNSF